MEEKMSEAMLFVLSNDTKLFDFLNSSLSGYYHDNRIARLDDMWKVFTEEVTVNEIAENSDLKALLDMPKDKLLDEIKRLTKEVVDDAMEEHFASIRDIFLQKVL